MKRHYTKYAAPLAALALTGCIDDGYDLSNIDTSSELTFKDLILPVNIDDVELSDVVDLNDNSKIKVMEIDGKKAYVITDKGAFSSDPIKVDRFSSKGAATDWDQVRFSSASGSGKLEYPVSQTLSFSFGNIDKAIVSAETVDCEPASLDIIIDASASGVPEGTTMRGISMIVTPGLSITSMPEGCAYDPDYGIMIVDQASFGSDGRIIIPLHFNAVNLVKATARFDDSSRTITVNSKIWLNEATVLAADGSELPSETNAAMKTDISDINVTAFSGELNYPLQGHGLDIPPINLDYFPYFFSEPGTDLKLVNPQLYMSLDNPLWQSYATIESGVEMVANRYDGTTATYSAEDMLRVGNALQDERQNFVLSPKEPKGADVPEDYRRMLQHVQFTSLQDVLSGGRVPYSIDVRLKDPRAFQQSVSGFSLGTVYKGIEGTYEFFAPMTLKNGEDGSQIIYHTHRTGWKSDIAKFTIDSLKIEADVNSTIPLGGYLIATPVDSEGKLMDVNLEGAQVDAKAFDQHVTVTASGVITDLNGIDFIAIIRPGNREETLGPDQKIELKNIRIKANGKYATDL